MTVIKDRQFRQYVLFLLFGLVLILLTSSLHAQGTSIPAAPGDQPLVWTEFSGDGLSLRVPSTWITLSDDAMLRNALDSIRESNPDLVPMFEQAQTLLENKSISLFLVDLVTGTNLNMAKLSSGGLSYTLEALQAALPSQYSSMGIELIETEILNLPAADALRIHARLQFNAAGGQVDHVEQIQYFMLDGDAIYVITFTAPESAFAAAEPIFNRIANTMQIEGSEQGWSRHTDIRNLLTIDAASDWVPVEVPSDSDFVLTLTHNGTAGVTMMVAPTEDSLEDVETAVTDDIDSRGIKLLATDHVLLPAGEFLRFHIVDATLPQAVEQYQYVTVDQGNQITVLFTANQDDFADTEPMFTRMMDTLHLLPQAE